MASSRTELKGVVDRFLDALVARDPSRLPLTKAVRYTENGQPLELGDGIWRTASGLGAYRLDVAEPAAGGAGFYGLIDENGIPGLLALRLQVAAGRIAEIEAFLVRQEKSGLALQLSSETLFAPRPLAEFDAARFRRPATIWRGALAASKRSSREAMVAAAERYFDGIEQGRSDIVPFDEGCNRRENGVQTTSNAEGPAFDPAFPDFRVFSLSCAAQLDAGLFSYVSKVRRRDLVVDEELGVLFGVFFFDHAGTVRSIDVPGVGRVAVPPTYRVPSTFMAPHLFKIKGGSIRQIEAVVRPVPYGMPSGWEK